MVGPEGYDVTEDLLRTPPKVSQGQERPVQPSIATNLIRTSVVTPPSELRRDLVQMPAVLKGSWPVPRLPPERALPPGGSGDPAD